MVIAAARRETRPDSFSLLAAFIATEAGLEVEGIPKASQLEADRLAAASVDFNAGKENTGYSHD